MLFSSLLLANDYSNRFKNESNSGTPVCLDSTATNYNASWDPSVTYSVQFLFDNGSLVADNSVCEYIDDIGCTNSNAINYNENAIEDDGSCEYELIIDNEYSLIPYIHSEPISWGMYGLELNTTNTSLGIQNTEDAYEIISSINDSLVTPMSYCYNLESFGYNDWYLPAITELDVLRSTIQSVYGNIDLWTSTEHTPTRAYSYNISSGNEYTTYKDTPLDVVCIRKDIYGCTDSLAFNYDVYANIDNGNCEEVVYGCLDDNAVNYETTANIDDGSCEYELIIDNEYSLIPYIHSEPMSWGMYGLELNTTNTSLGIQNTEDAYEIISSINDSLVTPMSYCYNLESFGYNDWYLPAITELDVLRSTIQSVYGNIDLWTSTEHTPTRAYSYNISSGNDYSTPKDTPLDVVCIRKNIYGCTDSLAFNYELSANTNDATCIEKVYGCIDEDAYNYNSSANTNDNSCVYLDSEVIFEESFNSFFNSESVNTESCWEVIQYYTESELSIDGTPFLFSNSNLSDCDYGYVIKVEHNTDVDSLVLEFDYVFEEYSGNNLIYLSSDSLDWFPVENFSSSDEVNWSNVKRFKINLSNYLTETLYVKFYRSTSSYTDYWAIDNIIVKGYYYNFGCVDSTAENYNPIATIDMGNCLYNFSVEDLLAEMQDCIGANNISIDLLYGWNIIGFTCDQPINAIDAFQQINESVVILKDNSGAVYMPEWGFNGIGNLQPGYGYQLKLSEAVSDFNICE
jgi:hypothetical protein